MIKIDLPSVNGRKKLEGEHLKGFNGIWQIFTDGVVEFVVVVVVVEREEAEARLGEKFGDGNKVICFSSHARFD